ncbi:hypothetical protein ES703_47961 [subsurface metagenome]
MLIDIHCHMNLYLIPEDIISDARQVGVEKIIAVDSDKVYNLI